MRKIYFRTAEHTEILHLKSISVLLASVLKRILGVIFPFGNTYLQSQFDLVYYMGISISRGLEFQGIEFQLT